MLWRNRHESIQFTAKSIILYTRIPASGAGREFFLNFSVTDPPHKEALSVAVAIIVGG